MTARSEIEKHQHSLDSRLRPNLYQKRTVSMSHFREMPSADIEVAAVHEPPPRRTKSVSVCIAALPSASQPRTIDQFEQQAMKNGFPQSLSAYELHEVRLPSLSTSEVFHEAPGMYVYRERPVTYPYMKPKQKWSCITFAKKRKHTICAWTFGIVAITVVMTIIIIQMAGVS